MNTVSLIVAFLVLGFALALLERLGNLLRAMWDKGGFYTKEEYQAKVNELQEHIDENLSYIEHVKVLQDELKKQKRRRVATENTLIRLKSEMSKALPGNEHEYDVMYGMANFYGWCKMIDSTLNSTSRSL
jgi:hypothetical protein